MRFGLQHPNFTYDGRGGEIFDTLSRRARDAEITASIASG
jgi:hypothetical protein